MALRACLTKLRDGWRTCATRSRHTLLLVGIALTAIPAAGLAQDHLHDFAAPAFELPETILVPIRFEGAIAPQAGWVLTYRNDLRGAKTPDREIEARRVRSPGPDSDSIDGLISWEIVRTRNDSCSSRTNGPCPDTIRVLSVPDGFIAVPEALSVEEGAVLKIHIVPAGIG